MSLGNVYFGAALAVFFLWNMGFVYAIRARRNDIADVLWGLGLLAAVGGGLCAQPHRLGPLESTLLLCLTLWALRLSLHIGRRFISHEKEDQRYAKWRRDWGASWRWRSYLQIFVLQPTVSLMIAASTLHGLSLAPQRAPLALVLGAVVFAIGFLFESIGDEQLRRFQANPRNKGRLMTRGLWSWTRHPNYFGEVVQWWGLFLLSNPTLSAWWTVVSPLTITFFILKVSGVPMLEDLMRDRPGFEEYAARTSIFFPRPPKVAP